MADTNTLHFTEGDKIKFTHYSNIDPRPVCVGTVEKVYGSSLVGALTKSYQMDVKIEDVLNNHWAKDMLVGKTVRLQVRPDSDIVKLDENTLKRIVVKSKEKLKEGRQGFSRDADSYGEELRTRERKGIKPQEDELREHSRKILMGIYGDLHSWETYAMDHSKGIDKQAAFDAYMAAMDAIETLGKAFYGDEFWGN